VEAVKPRQAVVTTDPKGPVGCLREGMHVIRHAFRHLEGTMIQLVQRQIILDLRGSTGNTEQQEE
jgi:hypothetical protein